MILASDVFGSGSNIETLLFGSLLLVDGGDLALAGAVAVATLLASALVGHHWLRSGFDPTLQTVGGPSPRCSTPLLLGLVALATVAALTGGRDAARRRALPHPGDHRPPADRPPPRWQALSVALVAVEGTAGLWLSVKTNAPPGATIACVAGRDLRFRRDHGRALVRVPRRAAVAAPSARSPWSARAAAGRGTATRRTRSRSSRRPPRSATSFARWAATRVTVTQLLQPNSDPHDYEPRPSDVEADAGART